MSHASTSQRLSLHFVQSGGIPDGSLHSQCVTMETTSVQPGPTVLKPVVGGCACAAGLTE